MGKLETRQLLKKRIHAGLKKAANRKVRPNGGRGKNFEAWLKLQGFRKPASGLISTNHIVGDQTDTIIAKRALAAQANPQSPATALANTNATASMSVSAKNALSDQGYLADRTSKGLPQPQTMAPSEISADYSRYLAERHTGLRSEMATTLAAAATHASNIAEDARNPPPTPTPPLSADDVHERVAQAHAHAMATPAAAPDAGEEYDYPPVHEENHDIPYTDGWNIPYEDAEHPMYDDFTVDDVESDQRRAIGKAAADDAAHVARGKIRAADFAARPAAEKRGADPLGNERRVKARPTTEGVAAGEKRGADPLGNERRVKARPTANNAVYDFAARPPATKRGAVDPFVDVEDDRNVRSRPRGDSAGASDAMDMDGLGLRYKKRRVYRGGGLTVTEVAQLNARKPMLHADYAHAAMTVELWLRHMRAHDREVNGGGPAYKLKNDDMRDAYEYLDRHGGRAKHVTI